MTNQQAKGFFKDWFPAVCIICGFVFNYAYNSADIKYIRESIEQMGKAHADSEQKTNIQMDIFKTEISNIQTRTTLLEYQVREIKKDK